MPWLLRALIPLVTAAIAAAQAGSTDPSKDLGRLPLGTRAVTISGKVALEDGSVPITPVELQRVCPSGTRREGKTDSKGRFSIDLEKIDLSAVMQQNEMREQDPLKGCVLRALAEGYESAEVPISGHKYGEQQNLGTLVLRSRGPMQGHLNSATSESAPKDARKAYERATDALKKSKPDDAEKFYRKAVELYPNYAGAWNELGQLYDRKNQREDARKAFEAAIQADPKYVPPLDNLSFLQAKGQQWAEVIQTTDKAIALDPYDFPRAYFYNGVAHYTLHEFVPAEKSVLSAMKIDKDHTIPQLEFQLGLILAQKRDYAGATQHIKEYLRLAPQGDDAAMAKQQLAAIDQLQTKK